MPPSTQADRDASRPSPPGDGPRRVDPLAKTSLPAGDWLPRLGLILVVLAVLGIFLPTLGFPFLQYDEQFQLVDNPLVRSLAPANIARIFTSFSITNYYPVRVLSFAVDYALWGLRPAGYRLTNILLHVANTLLMFALVWRLLCPPGNKPASRWANWWAGTTAAGFFALHPIAVEPVVWVAGREELLMVFFSLGCIHFHVCGGIVRPGPGGRARVVALHLLAGASAACACMSNVVAAAVPLLVVAYELVIVRGFRRAVTRTWFLWLVSFGTIAAKKMGDRVARDLGVLTEEGLHLGPIERIRAVLDGYWLNIKALLWPVDLVALYPKAVPPSFSSPTVLLGVLLAFGTLGLLWAVRRHRVVLFGLLWFLLALAPSSQVIPHHIHHADRFLYLPLVGLALAVGAAARSLFVSRVPAVFLAPVLMVLLLAMTVRSASQTRVWRNTETVFAHCVEVYPDVADARNNLGLALAAKADWTGADPHLSRAVDLRPTDPEFQFNLGVVRRHLADLDGAVRHLNEAIRLRPAMHDAHYELAQVRMAEKRDTQAIVHLRDALRVKPDYADAHHVLGILLAAGNEFAEAIHHYHEALRLHPGWPAAANNLAWLLATCPDSSLRHGTEAVRLAEAAARVIGDRDPQALDTLAAAYAEVGRFDDAVAASRKAIALATLRDDVALRQELETRADLYAAHQPYRAPIATSAAVP